MKIGINQDWINVFYYVAVFNQPDSYASAVVKDVLGVKTLEGIAAKGYGNDGEILKCLLNGDTPTIYPNKNQNCRTISEIGDEITSEILGSNNYKTQKKYIATGVLGHASVSVTKTYYADVKDKEMAETFMKIGIIGNISRTDETLIPDAGELHWFLSNKNGAARLCDGYCTRPVSDGRICERLLKRQKCYTCSRFITTVEDLAAHRSHLRELEVLMEGNLYGEHYSKHFVRVIAILKEIIRRLEVIAVGDEQLLSEESD